jgi:hypothetical protein
VLGLESPLGRQVPGQDDTLAVEHGEAVLQVVEQVPMEGADPVQLTGTAPELRVEGRQLGIGRLELLVGGLRLLDRRSVLLGDSRHVLLEARLLAGLHREHEDAAQLIAFAQLHDPDVGMHGLAVALVLGACQGRPC